MSYRPLKNLKKLLSTKNRGLTELVFYRYLTTRISPNSKLVDDFRRILGDKSVSTAYAVREQHGKDESYFKGLPPDVVIFPHTTQQVSRCAKLCHDNDVPMVPFGAGTGMEGGTVAAAPGTVTFDLSNMNKVTEFHPKDFDCTVEAGVGRLQLNNHIKDFGLWFPVDPGADCTVCGMAATSASGTNAVRYKTMKENTLNLEVVLADGRIFHSTGEDRRPKKTAAGYNLTNLFVGSEGTLGFITKCTVKLHGIAEATVAATCNFPDVKSAVDATIMILQSRIPVARVEFLDDVQVNACNLYSKLTLKEAQTLFLEFNGSANSVADQVEQVCEIVQMFGGSDFDFAVTQEDRNKLWAARHNAFYAGLALRPGSRAIVTDVCVPISNLAEIIVATKEDIRKSSLIGPIVGHVGDGNFHTQLLVDINNELEVQEAKTLADRMADHALDLNGTCTGEHGIGLGKRTLLEREVGHTGVEVMKQIKLTLDPKWLMNPGKVLML